MSDYDFLLANRDAALRLNRPEAFHLTSRIAIRDYIRIADEIAAAAPGARLLDWGCGFGQMSYLLKRRGLDVVSYDIGAEDDANELPVMREIERIVGSDPVLLPFKNGEFDAVLSCGVLEHVPDEEGSLREICRILRPQGYLFIYNLPNKYSYKEFLIERFRLGYSHERKYNLRTITSLLGAHGLVIRQARYGGLMPHTLTGVPRPVRSLYDRAAIPVYAFDRIASRIPGLNLISEAHEIIAKRGA